MASEFFGRQRECRFYTAGCGNKMVVSVTGPRAVNELGCPVIPGSMLLCRILVILDELDSLYFFHRTVMPRHLTTGDT